MGSPRPFVTCSDSRPCPHCQGTSWCFALDGGATACYRVAEGGKPLSDRQGQPYRLFFAPEGADKPRKPRDRQRTAEWVYVSPAGEPVLRVTRYDSPRGKSYAQASYRGGTWVPAGMAATPLYHADRLAAADPATPVCVVEGEQAATWAAQIGLLATTAPEGAGKWGKLDPAYRTLLTGRHVIILPDHDAPGRRHAADIARDLQGWADSVRVLELPGVSAKGDIVDWIAAGGTRERLLELAAGAPTGAEWLAGQEPPRPAPPAPDPDEKPTDTLLRLAERLELSQYEGVAYGTLTLGTRRETHRLPSVALRRWLTMQYYRDRGWPAQKDALASVLALLEARALDEGPERPIYLRVARHGPNLYLDLCDKLGQVVEVTPAGWRVITEPPVLFARPPKMQALPVPVPGTLQPLKDLLRTDEEGWRLSVAWVLHAYTTGAPYPILTLTGPEGAAKTSTARMLRGLVDPHKLAVRGIPKELEDVAVGAAGSHVYALDNLSTIPEWLSDGLCCLSSGGGIGRRQRYTDDEEACTVYCRPQILTGITIMGKPDLADRMLRVTLDAVPDDERRTEADVVAAYESARPGILGALLDAVSCGLRRLSQVSLANLPRLADFALWATACEAALPWPEGGVMAALTAGRESLAGQTVAGDIIGSVLLDMLDRQPANECGVRTWKGTASELLGRLWDLATEAARRSKHWPMTPHSLSRRLRALEGALRRQHVTVERDREGKVGTRQITIQMLPPPPEHDPAPADANGPADAGRRRQDMSQRQPESGVNTGGDGPADGADGDSPSFFKKVEVRGESDDSQPEPPAPSGESRRDLASAAPERQPQPPKTRQDAIRAADAQADANAPADANGCRCVGGALCDGCRAAVLGVDL